jgi:hypothetical protein
MQAPDMSALEDLPIDFTRYLSQRLGLSAEEAANLLGAWLKDYEPVSCRPEGVSRRSSPVASSSPATSSESLDGSSERLDAAQRSG